MEYKVRSPPWKLYRSNLLSRFVNLMYFGFLLNKRINTHTNIYIKVGLWLSKKDKYKKKYSKI